MLKTLLADMNIPTGYLDNQSTIVRFELLFLTGIDIH